MPTLRSFEVLVAIADSGSVSAAARLLQLTQPAVSHQLAALERELGAELVHRGARGAVLTRSGRAVMEPARAAVVAARRAIDAIRVGDASEPIRVAVAESFTLPFVLPMVSRWNSDGLGRLQLVETTSAAQAVSELSDGTHDIVIAPGPLAGKDLSAVRLGVEPIVVVGQAAISAPQEPVPFRAIEQYDLIGVDASNGFAGWLAEQCARAGVACRADVTVRSLEKAAAFADAGFGVALVARSAVPLGVQCVDLDPPLERPILAFTRRERDPVVDEFVARVRDHVGSVTGSWKV